MNQTTNDAGLTHESMMAALHAQWHHSDVSPPHILSFTSDWEVSDAVAETWSYLSSWSALAYVCRLCDLCMTEEVDSDSVEAG